VPAQTTNPNHLAKSLARNRSTRHAISAIFDWSRRVSAGVNQHAMSEIETHAPMESWLNAWHVNPSANRDYDFIDGLRGIAILMVVCCHDLYVNPNSGPAIQFFGAFFGAGAGGVVLFYALSGFLISWPFWKRKFATDKQVVPRGYARRRFWKIYPPLALSILVLTPLYMFLDPDGSYLPIAARWLAGFCRWSFSWQGGFRPGLVCGLSR
jgi:hypothetical protein